MNLVDSSGWMHYFMNGPLAESMAEYLTHSDKVLTPTVVLYEVYKKLKAYHGEEFALNACAQLEKTNLVVMTPEIAYKAADLSLQYKLAMADSMVYATANVYKAKLVTSDADFKDLPNVVYLNSQSPHEE